MRNILELEDYVAAKTTEVTEVGITKPDSQNSDIVK